MLFENGDLFFDAVDPDAAVAAWQEMALPQEQEDEIDLQALADEVYALMIKELKLDRQRLGLRR